MKLNKWTIGLASLGLVSLTPAVMAQTAAQGTPLLTSLSATTISGYVDTSAIWSPGTGNGHPAPYAFDSANKLDGFNLNSVDLKLSKPIEEGKYSAGYVAEVSYGPDAQVIDGGAYPIRQAYVELGIPVGNGLSLKVGRFDGIQGYEGNDAMNEPNYTRSYGYTFDHQEETGVLAAYKIVDWVQVQLGMANTLGTSGTSVNARSLGGPIVESKKAYLGLVTVTAPDSWGFMKGSTIYGGAQFGQGVYGSDTTEFYLGLTLNTPVKDLALGFSWDSIQDVALSTAGSPNTNISGMGGVDAGYFQSFAAYASYRVTDKLTVNGRAEYADGTALSSAEAILGNRMGTLTKVFALTGTVQYDLWENVITRAEIRWDHAAGGAGGAFGGDTSGTPGVSTGGKNNQVIFAANVIYKF